MLTDVGGAANKWIALAKKAGMKYVCLTTQHHDGYALFESKYMNAFTSKNTHNRDFVKEYVETCREAGLKVGLYKTLINWRFPGYFMPDLYWESAEDERGTLLSSEGTDDQLWKD